MKKIVLIAAFAVLGIGSVSAKKLLVETSCGKYIVVETDDYLGNTEAMLKDIQRRDALACPKKVEDSKDTDIRDKP